MSLANRQRRRCAKRKADSDFIYGNQLACKCQTAINVNTMVQCIKCSEWFHPVCAGDPRPASEVERNWHCKDCGGGPVASKALEITPQQPKRLGSGREPRKRLKMASASPSPLQAARGRTAARRSRRAAQAHTAARQAAPTRFEDDVVLAAALAAAGVDAVPRDLGALDPHALMTLEILRAAAVHLTPPCSPSKPSALRRGAASLSGMGRNVRRPATIDYVAVDSCPNRSNPAHACSAYCFWRWQAGSDTLAQFHASRSQLPDEKDDDNDDEDEDGEGPAVHTAREELAPAAVPRNRADHKRIFHNQRERQRRSTIRQLFESLRTSVPNVVEHASTSDRQILTEAAHYIQDLSDESKDLESELISLRIDNLRLRLHNQRQLKTGDGSEVAALEQSLAIVLAGAAEISRLKAQQRQQEAAEDEVEDAAHAAHARGARRSYGGHESGDDDSGDNQEYDNQDDSYEPARHRSCQGFSSVAQHADEEDDHDEDDYSTSSASDAVGEGASDGMGSSNPATSSMGSAELVSLLQVAEVELEQLPSH